MAVLMWAGEIVSCIKRHTLLKFLGLKKEFRFGIQTNVQLSTLTMIIKSTSCSLELFYSGY